MKESYTDLPGIVLFVAFFFRQVFLIISTGFSIEGTESARFSLDRSIRSSVVKNFACLGQTRCLAPLKLVAAQVLTSWLAKEEANGNVYSAWPPSVMANLGESDFRLAGCTPSTPVRSTSSYL